MHLMYTPNHLNEFPQSHKVLVLPWQSVLHIYSRGMGMLKDMLLVKHAKLSVYVSIKLTQSVLESVCESTSQTSPVEGG